MKDYEHVVVWLDYFNKNLKRSEGRRLRQDMCIFDPTLKELISATTSAGFKITESKDRARFPRRPFVRSGYVMLPKGSAKTQILSKISEKMVSKRIKQPKRN